MDEYPPTIFVVDDDRSVLKSLKRLLQSNGYKVETFPSAHEFMEFDYDSKGPACLILDVMMPEMSGLDLQETILSWDISLPIVFITALRSWKRWKSTPWRNSCRWPGGSVFNPPAPIRVNRQPIHDDFTNDDW